MTSKMTIAVEKQDVVLLNTFKELMGEVAEACRKAGVETRGAGCTVFVTKPTTNLLPGEIPTPTDIVLGKYQIKVACQEILWDDGLELAEAIANGWTPLGFFLSQTVEGGVRIVEDLFKSAKAISNAKWLFAHKVIELLQLYYCM